MVPGVVAITLSAALGCFGAPSQIQVAGLEPNGTSVQVAVVPAGGLRLVTPRVHREDGVWYLTGRLESATRLFPTTDRTLLINSVRSDGSVASSTTTVAQRKPTSIRFRGPREAGFKVQIPEPGTFDHLIVSVAPTAAETGNGC